MRNSKPQLSINKTVIYYLTMRQLYNFLKNYKLRGILIYIKLRFQLTTKLKIPNIKHKIFIRKQTSDIPTFYQIFGNQEYGEIPIKFSPKTIIDLGALAPDGVLEYA